MGGWNPSETAHFRRLKAIYQMGDAQILSTRKTGIDNAAAFLVIIAQIPLGRVATYGQIARLAGVPRNCRQVGSVLNKLPNKSAIPWHRVVNSKGEISSRGHGDSELIQYTKLISEGVVFNKRNRISLRQFGWSVDEK